MQHDEPYVKEKWDLFALLTQSETLIINLICDPSSL
jgi:hypothetical protein